MLQRDHICFQLSRLVAFFPLKQQMLKLCSEKPVCRSCYCQDLTMRKMEDQLCREIDDMSRGKFCQGFAHMWHGIQGCGYVQKKRNPQSWHGKNLSCVCIWSVEDNVYRKWFYHMTCSTSLVPSFKSISLFFASNQQLVKLFRNRNGRHQHQRTTIGLDI